jgi:uncharacterized protein (DUF488 family)
MPDLTVATIGFTQKNAKEFFNLLQGSKATHLIDVRLNNSSQLAGFAKREDLTFFLDAVLGWKYDHVPDLAPTKDILDAYKKHKGDWAVYEYEFLALMEKRRIDHHLDPTLLDGGCLLCSEHLPDHCHRRLIVNFLNRKWDANLEVTHLF